MFLSCNISLKSNVVGLTLVTKSLFDLASAIIVFNIASCLTGLDKSLKSS